MTHGKAVIFNLCVNRILPGLSSTLKKQLNFEVRIFEDQFALSEESGQFHPDLIFWIDDEVSVERFGFISEFKDTPVLLALCLGGRESGSLECLPDRFDDVLIEPFSERELIWKTRRLLSRISWQERWGARQNILEELGLEGFIGQAPLFLEALQRLRLIAATDATVLLSGETGVGKELCARALHYLSKRSGGAFVPVNCGAIPSNLFENELFGHQSGAFTDARCSRVGLLAEAQGGTLFLDELEALSLEAQSTLLRLLQDNCYRPLGATQAVGADVRFLAATNVELREAVKAGRFRSDLFYRLTLSLRLPPLRARKSDIPLLANHFLRIYRREYGREGQSLSKAAVHKLLRHDWPGNVRELENIIQEAILLSAGSVIPAENISFVNEFSAVEYDKLSFREAKHQILERFERDYIAQCLFECQGNVSLAAKAANKDRRDFAKLMQKYQIDAEGFKMLEP